MTSPSAAAGHAADRDAVEALASGVRAADRRSIARAISLVERGGVEADALLAMLGTGLAGAQRVGITGPPGAGKSTLVSRLAKAVLDAGRSVGIVAVDPTSPFTRGAVLGDRVRMADLEGDDRVFIRSMAHRGFAGGLAARSHDVADVLTAAGFDLVLVESLGVGQAELDVRRIVDTTVVVLVPESGDQVQAIKAGLMEIADLYVLNKADRPGAQSVLAGVQGNLPLQHRADPDWTPDVLATQANVGEGVAEVLGAIERHFAHLLEGDRLHARRAERMQTRLVRRLEELVAEQLWTDARRARLSAHASALALGRLGIDEAVRDLLEDFLGRSE